MLEATQWGLVRVSGILLCSRQSQIEVSLRTLDLVHRGRVSLEFQLGSVRC